MRRSVKRKLSAGEQLESIAALVKILRRTQNLGAELTGLRYVRFVQKKCAVKFLSSLAHTHRFLNRRNRAIVGYDQHWALCRTIRLRRRVGTVSKSSNVTHVRYIAGSGKRMA